MTEQDILRIVENNGQFILTWHYRVDDIRAKCRKLVREGKLELVSSRKGADHWKLKGNK